MDCVSTAKIKLNRQPTLFDVSVYSDRLIAEKNQQYDLRNSLFLNIP